MARINLLPWRDELRKQRQKDFLTMLVIAFSVSAATVFLVHSHFAGMISNQNLRNQTIQRENKKLDLKIKEIQGLDAKRERLLARMKVIQDLQGSRPLIVHVFDELVKTLPEGAYLQTIKRTGNVLTINGVADSNGRISTYMRWLDKSAWCKDAKLDISEDMPTGGKSFKLGVKTYNPEAQEEGIQ